MEVRQQESLTKFWNSNIRQSTVGQKVDGWGWGAGEGGGGLVDNKKVSQRILDFHIRHANFGQRVEVKGRGGGVCRQQESLTDRILEFSHQVASVGQKIWWGGGGGGEEKKKASQRILEFSHQTAAVGEVHDGQEGKGQLDALQHVHPHGHLVQLGGHHHRHDDRRHNGDGSGDEHPLPLGPVNVQKPLANTAQ